MEGGKPRIYTTSFAALYPLYMQKAEGKGRTKAEVDEVVRWLTGHGEASLHAAVASHVDVERFFLEAPRYNPRSDLITGVVCGVRVEAIEDLTMRRIRHLDKLIDELARGKPMAKVLR
jgi:hypothetical protein